MTFIRFFIGGLILLPFSISKIKKDNIKLTKSDYLVMTLLGVLCICISMVLLQYAVLKADNPALIAIIFSSNSVFTIALSAIVFKDKITIAKIFAVLLCIAGILVCADLKTGTNITSVILAVLAALSFSLYTVLSKKYMTKITGVVQTGLSFVIGSLVLLAVLICFRVQVISSINSSNIIQLLYLGVFVTGIGYWSYFSAMKKSSAMAASLVFFIKPILTPFAAFALNGIAPDLKVFIALILVLVGSYFVTYKN